MTKYLSIKTLNVNGLNAPIKRHRVAEWIRKQDPQICCLQETDLRTKDLYRLKVKGWKKIFHAKGHERKAGVVIIISDKIDFKTKVITRDKEDHYIILKGAVQEEDITHVNTYTPDIGAPKYIKKILEDFQKEIKSNTVIIGIFNNPLSTMDRSSRQKKINEDREVLNDTLNQIDLIDIYRIFHSKEAKYTFFRVHRLFPKMDHMIGHKIAINKFKKIEII